jgi:hypothetical protein
MNALDRLLAVTAVVAVSAATLPGLWPLLSPQADLWKAPADLRQIQRLSDEADDLDSRYALLHRIHGAREQVIAALSEGRLTAGQAVTRFRELDEIRSESGLPVAPERRHKSPAEIARLEVLGWLSTAPPTLNHAVLDQVVRELTASIKSNSREGQVQ